jgi:hypothetical protein
MKIRRILKKLFYFLLQAKKGYKKHENNTQ